MTPTQERLVTMMAWFHNYCIKNNLTYYAIGGTMLGAARHRGFIPWDDDIDVGMPREDFTKLQNILEGNCDNPYRFESYKSKAKDFIYSYGKLFDINSLVIENNSSEAIRGIFIDIFPLDGIGSTIEEARKNYREINYLLTVKDIMFTEPNKKRVFYKNWIIILTRTFFRWDKINARVVSISTQRQYSSSNYVGNLVGAWRFKEIIPREYLGKPTLYDFESIKIFGAEQYDKYLTSLYGNWRKLPPKEKQQSNHDYIKYSLDESYLDYKNSRKL